MRSFNIGSVSSVLNNDPSTPCMESPEDPESLLQGTWLAPTSSFSPKTNSSSDSLDSDMFSISDNSDHFELADPQGTLRLIVNKISQQLYAGFRTLASLPPSNNEGSSSFVSSIAIPSQDGKVSRASRKRKCPEDEEDDYGEDGSNPHRPKKPKLAPSENCQKPFACPYLKKDANEYRTCSGFSLNRIRDVKLHLIRKHTPERYCQRCQAIDFPDKESLQSHIVKGKCSPKDPTMLSWVSYEQRHELHKKSKPNTCGEDQWLAIWEVLFPGCRRPNSVYVDTKLALGVRQFREHCVIQGPAVITEVIESDPAWLDSDISEEQRRIILRRAIAEGISNLFEDWLLNASPSTLETTRDENSGRTQASPNETPASSMVDSGVAVGGSSSSGEQPRMQSFGSDFFPTFGSSQSGFDFGVSQPEATNYLVRRSPVHSIYPVTTTTLTLAQDMSFPSFDPITDNQGTSWQGQFNSIETNPGTTLQPSFGTDDPYQPREDGWNGGYPLPPLPWDENILQR